MRMKIDLRRVRAERVASGLSQDQVAKKMGWKTRTPYAKRENGIVSIGADELIKLAYMFGYTKENVGIFFTNDVLYKEQYETRKEENK